MVPNHLLVAMFYAANLYTLFVKHIIYKFIIIMPTKLYQFKK